MAITLGLRPRLTFEVPGEASALGQRVREGTGDYPVTVVGTYLVITIPEARRHFWSPQLQVTLEDRDGKVCVNGLLTPMPAVWTLFAGIYGLIIVLGFFATIYGLAQWQLGHSPHALWSFPVTLLLVAGVYAAAMTGQRFGREQSEELTVFLRGCLD